MSEQIQNFKNQWQNSDLYYDENTSDIMDIISANNIELMPFQTTQDGIDEVKEFWKDAKSFYDNLKEIFNFKTGERDGEHWAVLGKFSNDVYFYINAWCSYTGFDCKGGIRVHCSRDLDLLMKMGISNKQIQ